MARTNLYVIGQVVRATVTLHTRVAGVLTLTDPSTLTFYVTTPSGTTFTYIYQTDSQPIRDSIGVYHVDFPVEESGEWVYRYESTGAAAGAGEKHFNVNHSEIPEVEA